jgi:pimeloyl-ACP methyl ester carboxylesterase
MTARRQSSSRVGGRVALAICEPKIELPTCSIQQFDGPSRARRRNDAFDNRCRRSREFMVPTTRTLARLGKGQAPRRAGRSASAIIGESEWLETLWAKRAASKSTPTVLLWGLKDVALTADLLARWENACPNHTTLTFPTVEHFAPKEMDRTRLQSLNPFSRPTDSF